MEKHEIDMAAIDGARTAREHDFDVAPLPLKQMAKCDRYLAIAMARLLGLKPVLSKTRMVYCGDRPSIAIARELYMILRATMNRCARLVARTARRRTKFKNGFALGVLSQVAKLPKSDAIDAKYTRASDLAEKQFSLTKYKFREKFSRSREYAAGAAAGLKTNLGYDSNLGSSGAAPQLGFSGN